MALRASGRLIVTISMRPRRSRRTFTSGPRAAGRSTGDALDRGACITHRFDVVVSEAGQLAQLEREWHELFAGAGVVGASEPAEAERAVDLALELHNLAPPLGVALGERLAPHRTKPDVGDLISSHEVDRAPDGLVVGRLAEPDRLAEDIQRQAFKATVHAHNAL